jgi:hypothetical protein
MPRLYLALVHHPVINKTGDVIASAVTNLDVHDLARIGRTFDVRRVYVVTPLCDQQELVHRILDHWCRGFGADHNPHRSQAMDRIRVCDALDGAVGAIRRREARPPRVVATCARSGPRRIGFAALRRWIADDDPCLLVFGTAWGLADTVLERADAVLEPIPGAGGYNHLPVRAAAAIILDRLAGRE